MSIEIIQRRLDGYRCQSVQEEALALREITQEVALTALGRSEFFRYAAFQGGTCLRIFYGLNRFSEDLDFILRKPAPDFKFDRFFKSMAAEFAAYGYRLEVVDRSKEDGSVKKAFIKDDSLGKVLILRHLKVNRSTAKITIKFEVDIRPPAGSCFESRFLVFPFASEILCQDQPSLFAGKLHALLCREYVKGRDWYDLLFYAGRKVRPNLGFLSAALDQTGPWAGHKILVDGKWCFEQLSVKINRVDWDAARVDIRRFVRPQELASLSYWGRELFLDQIVWLGQEPG